MDVNGTQFHLISGEEGWSRHILDTTPDGVRSQWHDENGTMGLKTDLALFPRGSGLANLALENRRGSACDRFGTWYWIGQDQQTIFRAPAGSGSPVPYWPPTPESGPQWPRDRQGDFAAHTPEGEPIVLVGLTITNHHYMVVGELSQPGLLIFDLHAGGEPVRLQFQSAVPFQPFDLAPAADGGVWVLDRHNKRLWGLDRNFRILPLQQPLEIEPGPGSFRAPNEIPLRRESAPAAGLVLAANNPLAIVVSTDGSLFILDEPARIEDNSRLLFFMPGPEPGILSEPVGAELPDLAEVAQNERDGSPPRPVVGYDLALMPETNYLLVVEQEGNQVIAYGFDPQAQDVGDLNLEPKPLYLPLHHFGARALTIGTTPDGETAIFYDVSPAPDKDLLTRWVRIQAIDQSRYHRLAWLEIKEPLDSRQREATWHRLFLDACIPPETGVEVWTRAADDKDLLVDEPYRHEPTPYRRGVGAEIPYWDPWPDLDLSSPAGQYRGTWEVLLQRAQGRWLQVRLVLTGNGRASPQIRNLRAYYPRFSYVRQYLPAIYQEQDRPAAFLERFLANMEGAFTELEGKIANASVLFDPRTAPADGLNWLATWLGLVLDPLWTSVSRQDRRRLMIRFARRLYEQRGTPDGLRFALLLLLDPCLERTMARLERAVVVPDEALRQALEILGLPYPTPDMDESELEDLLYRFVLSAPGRSRVRIVEHWQSRHGLAAESGDPTREADQSQADPIDEQSPPCGPKAFHPDCRELAGKAAGESAVTDPSQIVKIVEETAHRFSVLIPEDLSGQDAAMVEKIIRLEKPAHTSYDVRRFWDYFLVGQVRLGIDTVLGEESRFSPIILGRDALSEGYLESAHPMNIGERTVINRDALGK